MQRASLGSNGGERSRKGPLNSHRVSGAASDNKVLESSEGTEINGSQLELKIVKNTSRTLKIGDNFNTADSLRSLSITHPPHMGQSGGARRIPLTARALRQHNNQQRHTSQQQDAVVMRTIDASAGETYVPYGDGAGDRNNSLSDARFYTKRNNHGRKTMSNKADGSVTDQEATANLGSYLGVEENATDQLGEVTDYAHLSYWDTGTTYEQITGMNDLAGVGEHLADYSYQGYTIDGKLVVE